MSNITLNLLVEHPTIDPALITGNLRLQPQLIQRAGDDVVTPKGSVVPDSKYRFSKWGYNVHIPAHDDIEKRFSSLVGELFSQKDFVSSLSDGGGRVSVYFHFSNLKPLHFMVSSENMRKLVSMKIEFGFEVF